MYSNQVHYNIFNIAAHICITTKGKKTHKNASESQEKQSHTKRRCVFSQSLLLTFLYPCTFWRKTVVPFEVTYCHPRLHMGQQWLSFLINVFLEDFVFQITQFTGEILITMNEWLLCSIHSLEISSKVTSKYKETYWHLFLAIFELKFGIIN